jgi:S1-C subfamily serine protease
VIAKHRISAGAAGRHVGRWLIPLVLLAGCGGSGHARTVTVEKIVGASGPAPAFDAEGIYRREAPGVVTILSEGARGSQDGGLGSGFVLNGRGEIVTNAHVVTDGSGSARRAVAAVYVEFSDGNRVPATIRGYDPNADVALIRVDPSGLDLHPLPLGDSDRVRVGQPVAAIGSPFGERQSMSVGIVSAVNRDVDSLTRFQIDGALQTDAAINPGNSGGPLVDGRGRVLGLNQQIESSSGTGAGVGFAVPIDLAQRSLRALRAHGRVDYAYLGVSTQAVYPQLARHFHLGTQHGAWVQAVTSGGPAVAAGLRGGSGADQDFQADAVRPGGDVIVRVGPVAVRQPDDLSRAVARLEPGDTVSVVVVRGGSRKSVRVKLARRPESGPLPGG